MRTALRIPNCSFSILEISRILLCDCMIYILKYNHIIIFIIVMMRYEKLIHDVEHTAHSNAEAPEPVYTSKCGTLWYIIITIVILCTPFNAPRELRMYNVHMNKNLYHHHQQQTADSQEYIQFRSKQHINYIRDYVCALFSFSFRKCLKCPNIRMKNAICFVFVVWEWFLQSSLLSFLAIIVHYIHFASSRLLVLWVDEQLRFRFVTDVYMPLLNDFYSVWFGVMYGVKIPINSAGNIYQFHAIC